MTIPILPPGQNLPPDVPFAYVTARSGHYLKKRTAIFEACVKVPEIPSLPEEVESFRFTGPKIPAEMFAQVVAFFDAVRLEHKTEAVALLTFDGCWDVIIPEQEATGASVRYKVPTIVRLAGSIHSHPGFSAFFSNTDETDEEAFDGVHIVVGAGGFSMPEVSVAAVVSGRRIELEADAIIEGYGIGADFPADWLGRVNAQKLVAAPTWPGLPSPLEIPQEKESLCLSCAHLLECGNHSPNDGKMCLFYTAERLEEEGP